MSTGAKISLTIPGTNLPGRYFSFYLKQRGPIENSEYKKQKRIIVIDGNITSFNGFCKTLLKNKITDRKLNWTYSDGHLVVIGNGLLPQEQLISYWWLLYSLQQQASHADGYLHFLINHKEQKDLDISWRLSHPNYAIKKNDTQYHSTALYYGNSELWHWLQTKNRVEKIGKLLFTESESLLEINTAGFSTKEAVDRVLNQYKVHTIITGSSSDKEIVSYFEGKLIKIPKGELGSRSEALHINGKHYYRLGISNRKKQLY